MVLSFRWFLIAQSIVIISSSAEREDELPIKNLIESQCRSAISQITDAANDGGIDDMTQHNTMVTCSIENSSTTMNITEVLNTLTDMFLCSKLISAPSADYNLYAFTLNREEMTQQPLKDVRRISKATQGETHAEKFNICYRFHSGENTHTDSSHEDDTFVLLSVRVSDTYEIRLERRELGGRHVQFPRLLSQPVYRRLPKLNLHLPADFFYPFGCSAASRAQLSTVILLAIMLSSNPLIHLSQFFKLSLWL